MNAPADSDPVTALPKDAGQEPVMASDLAAGSPLQNFDQYAINSPGWIDSHDREADRTGTVTRAGDEV